MNDYTLLMVLFILTALILFGFWMLYSQINQKMDQTAASYMLSQQRDLSKDILQRKLQAYERLSLLLERIQYPNVIKRCYDTDLNAKDLINRMKVDIQAEFEHNVTQQIYVSEKLWEIIHLTKEDSLATLNDISMDLESYQSEQVFIRALIDKLSNKKYNPIDKALLAIRTEVGTLF